MLQTRVRSLRYLAVLAGLAVLLSGCQQDDPRIGDLAKGITKDSVMVVMEIPATERPSAYLINGQFIETFVVRRAGVEGPRDSLTRKQTTPVVLIAGQVAGWGWKYWDSVAAANNIPVEMKK